MSFGLTVLGGQKRLDEVPGHRRPDCPATHAENIHVIVLDPLPSREMIMDQRGTDAGDLVGADGCADAATADRDAAFDPPCRYSPRERRDKVRIVVVWAQAVCAEINDIMPGLAELRDQLLLQAEPAVIGGNADAHIGTSFIKLI
jgi:hypothetical protein